MIPLGIHIYERGVSGVPSTQFVTDLRARSDSYEHAISDRFGFESMRVFMQSTLAEVNDWLQNGLMRSVKVYGPEAEVVWEGFLETITATLGQKKASVSLRPMANRVRTKYVVDGVPGTTS